MTCPEVLTWAVLMCWGRISSSSAFDFYHLKHLTSTICADASGLTETWLKSLRHSNTTAPSRRSAIEADSRKLWIWLFWASCVKTFSLCLKYSLSRRVDPSCSRRVFRLEPGYSVNSHLFSGPLNMYFIWKESFLYFIWKKTASPRRTEKAWLQIHYEGDQATSLWGRWRGKSPLAGWGG